MLVKSKQLWNASSEISVTPSDNTTFSSEEQPKKNSRGITGISADHTTDVISLWFLNIPLLKFTTLHPSIWAGITRLGLSEIYVAIFTVLSFDILYSKGIALSSIAPHLWPQTIYHQRNASTYGAIQPQALSFRILTHHRNISDRRGGLWLEGQLMQKS